MPQPTTLQCAHFSTINLNPVSWSVLYSSGIQPFLFAYRRNLISTLYPQSCWYIILCPIKGQRKPMKVPTQCFSRVPVRFEPDTIDHKTSISPAEAARNGIKGRCRGRCGWTRVRYGKVLLRLYRHESVTRATSAPGGSEVI
jgi:hypothetical protein